MDAEKIERLTAAVRAAVRDERGKPRLQCADAFRIAAELGVERIDVGRTCTREGVRISACQLGCFE